MSSCEEVKPEPEEAEICLPVNHHLQSSCSHSYSYFLGVAQESTEPKLVPDCVDTECDSSPESLLDQTPHLRRTEKDGHPVILSQHDHAKGSNITEFKNDPTERFDDFLEDFIKQKCKEEAVNLNQTEDGVLRLSECEVSRSRVCRTLMYIFNNKPSGDTNGSTDVNRRFSKPNTSHGNDETESESYTHSESCMAKDKKVEGHDGRRKHFCHLCTRGYVRKYHLTVHMRTHTGTLHHCQECGRGFSRKGTLKEHMKIHSDPEKRQASHRRFICTECDKRFMHAYELKKHQMTHTGETPFICTVCDRGFIHAGDLKKHMRTHTGEKPFTCTECGHSFLRSDTLKKHMRIHTRERPYLCSECGKTFPYAFTYSSHMDNIHNIVIKKR